MRGNSGHGRSTETSDVWDGRRGCQRSELPGRTASVGGGGDDCSRTHVLADVGQRPRISVDRQGGRNGVKLKAGKKSYLPLDAVRQVDEDGLPGLHSLLCEVIR